MFGVEIWIPVIIGLAIGVPVFIASGFLTLRVLGRPTFREAWKQDRARLRGDDSSTNRTTTRSSGRQPLGRLLLVSGALLSFIGLGLLGLGSAKGLTIVLTLGIVLVAMGLFEIGAHVIRARRHR